MKQTERENNEKKRRKRKETGNAGHLKLKLSRVWKKKNVDLERDRGDRNGE